MKELARIRSQSQERSRGQSRYALLAFIALVVGLVRLPFFATRHIQEDAYITWRVAANLVEYGVIGFNPSERASAATSHIYMALSALAQVTFDDLFIFPLLASLSILTIVAAYLIMHAVWPGDPSTRTTIAAAILAVSPPLISASYLGMETALVMAVVGAALFLERRIRTKPQSPLCNYWVLALYLAMPFVRPEMFAIGLAAAGVQLVGGNAGTAFQRLVASLSGALALLVTNWAYFGHPIHQTIRAKLIPTPDSANGFARFKEAGEILGQNLGPIPPNRYTLDFGIVVLFLIAAGVGWLVRRGGGRRALVAHPELSMALLIIVGMSIPYAFAGVSFPWYFHLPSALLWACVLALAVSGWRGSPVIVVSAVVASIAAVALFIVALGDGASEYHHRRVVGLHLRAISEPHDVLILEPAGYIPFFSGLITHDEVGLVSDDVIQARQEFGEGWQIPFVRARPEISRWVMRDHILEGVLSGGYKMNAEEQAWFDREFEMVHRLDYRPEEYGYPEVFHPVLRVSSAATYYTFARRK